jgi:hypothetical protein
MGHDEDQDEYERVFEQCLRRGAAPAPQQQPQSRRAKRARADYTFFRFPVHWDDRLRDASSAAYKLAGHLLREDWEEHGEMLRLSSVGLARKGISRWQKRRALRELEVRGLVWVSREPRKAPRVMLLK